MIAFTSSCLSLARLALMLPLLTTGGRLKTAKLRVRAVIIGLDTPERRTRSVILCCSLPPLVHHRSSLSKALNALRLARPSGRTLKAHEGYSGERTVNRQALKLRDKRVHFQHLENCTNSLFLRRLLYYNYNGYSAGHVTL
jgi:hypothetical protein